MTCVRARPEGVANVGAWKVRPGIWNSAFVAPMAAIGAYPGTTAAIARRTASWFVIVSNGKGPGGSRRAASAQTTSTSLRISTPGAASPPSDTRTKLNMLSWVVACFSSSRASTGSTT